MVHGYYNSAQFCPGACSCTAPCGRYVIGSTTTIYITTDSTWAINQDIEVLRVAPLYGWWNTYRTARPEARMPMTVLPARPARPQARSCHIDRARWKRRRFLQALRRST